MQWQLQKNSLKERLREERERTELRECTFTPAINEESRLFVYDNMSSRSDVTELSDRLHKAKEFQERKQKFVESMRKQQEEELKKVCTFQPDVTGSKGRGGSRPSSPAPRSRYMNALKSSSSTSNLTGATATGSLIMTGSSPCVKSIISRIAYTGNKRIG